MSQFIGTPSVGIQGTFSLGGTDLVRDIARDVTVYDRESSPLMSFLTQTKGRVKPCQQPFYEWQENQYDYGTRNVAAGFTGGAATESITIDDPAAVVGDSYYEPITQQFFIVITFTSRDTSAGTSVVVVKVLPSGPNILATTTDTTLVSCGNLLVEGGYYPTAKGTRPSTKSNNITSATASVDITKILMKSATYFGSKWTQDKEAAITQFRCDMERNILMGKFFNETGFAQTSDNGTQTGTLRGTRGLINNTTSYTQSYSGSLTEDTLDNFLSSNVWPTKYSGSATKIGLFGNLATQNLNRNIKNTKLRVYQLGRMAYGFDIQEYMLFGNRRLLVMLEKEFYSVSPFAKGIFVVDPKFIWMRSLGANVMEVEDTSLPRQSGHSIVISADYGIEGRFEASCSLLKQV